MNAVIWFWLTLDAHTPTAARPATSSAAPTYCATTIPSSGAVPSARPSGTVRVIARAIRRNNT